LAGGWEGANGQAGVTDNLPSSRRRKKWLDSCCRSWCPIDCCNGGAMDLKLFEDFITLAETRSFSRAAERRNSAQSAFSRRIQSLERWVGAALIDRRSNPLQLTSA